MAPTPPTSPAALRTRIGSGAFAGGARIIGGSGSSGDPTPYFSIAGVRGDEIYLAPKLAFFIPPDLNINLSVR